MKKKGVIIYEKYDDDNAYDWMIKSAFKFNINLEVIFLDELTIKYENTITFYNKYKKLSNIDFVIMRCYEKNVSKAFESIDIKVINSTKAMFASKNKIETGRILKSNNIPMPNFIYGAYTYEEVNSFFKDEPFVLKGVESSAGEEVFLINSKAGFVESVKKTKHYYICQKYIKSSYGRDIRIYVIGDKVICAIERYNKKDFRSNLSLGGNVKLKELNEEIKSLALRSSKALGLEFSGVDLLYTADGYTVCEVNGNAGFRSLKNSKIDIVEEFFKYINKVV